MAKAKTAKNKKKNATQESERKTEKMMRQCCLGAWQKKDAKILFLFKAIWTSKKGKQTENRMKMMTQISIS